MNGQFELAVADKVENNIVFVCKANFINCILVELGINSAIDNPNYT